MFIRPVLITLRAKPAILTLLSASTLRKTDVYKRDAPAWGYQSFNKIKIKKPKLTIFIFLNCRTATS
jgi:hypothetical protein